MEKLKREHDTAIMLITHDMGVVSELADDVAVMYMGSIVERGSVREVLKYPAHPYTAALLRSIPILHKGRGQRLEPIRGSTPDPYDRPKGMPICPRCDFCCEKCRQEMPPEVPVCDGHAVRCWNAEQVYAGHREGGRSRMSEKKCCWSCGGEDLFPVRGGFSTRSGTMCRRSTTWTWTSTRGDSGAGRGVRLR